MLGGLALSVEWPRHTYPDVGTDAVQYGHATPSRVVRPVAYLIDGYQRVFYTYGPLFGLILLTGLGGVLRPRLRRRRFGSLRRPGGIRRILSTGESAGRSRRAQAW